MADQAELVGDGEELPPAAAGPGRDAASGPAPRSRPRAGRRAQTIGWYGRRNSCRSTARRRSVSSCSRSTAAGAWPRRTAHSGAAARRLARYMAESASRISSWPVRWASEHTAMPMLGVAKSTCPATLQRLAASRGCARPRARRRSAGGCRRAGRRTRRRRSGPACDRRRLALGRRQPHDDVFAADGAGQPLGERATAARRRRRGRGCRSRA